ncbi:16S rRNA (cytosine1402-N4)-methyltransferase [Candidatus Pelagibacter ubique]|uniref:Ribosomal RNA small subunit methyltransferase H n=1 Tax=Pelagibacter ubique TaxID=198252 RepID=A0ABX1T2A6_PELUQ|nr:16S rRNA (cytosine(1402)-N(4))-methyltransferase RsmH [Candidatus Pelagibacter ubique]NMN67584.1 16S rRNA (cytosine1402-N4)-methyltransferase [Candidatus Pelagibacter ubique]
MIATIIPDVRSHYPVLLTELISIITPQYGGTFIDCTFGQGGYTKKILNFKNTKVIALDRDLETLQKVEEIQNKYGKRFLFKNIKFSQLNNLKLKNESVKGVIFDLGYSYTQIKDPKKGLSFESTGQLNMKMGINNFSANEAINILDEKELSQIFKFFGDEKDSNRIAHNIVEDRETREITTEELVRIIESSKRKKKSKTHSATKVFQALRIFVNKEISELIYGLINAARVVKKDGIIAVVTFHSLEDKIVKYFFKSLSENKSVSRYMPKGEEKINLFKTINKKAIFPSEIEIKNNPPSRSAKLRYVIKKEDFYDFETDILEKFDYLIKIENFSKKL